MPTDGTDPVTTDNTNTTMSPLVITHGGTYAGSYSSITVATTEPVVLQDITGSNAKGNFIDAQGPVNLTVRRVKASANGWFVHADGFASVTVENCSTISGSDGILLENGINAAAAHVRYNSFDNIVGPYEHGNAVMIATTHNLSSAEIAYNRVVNVPGKSQVEDNINIYDSAGSAGSLIWIHDNYVQGAYPADPASGDFSGGGIICDYRASFVRIEHNTVVDTTNYGISIGSGHDNTMINNTVVFDELLPATNVGIGCYDAYHLGSSGYYNNTGSGNGVYTVNQNDWWLPGLSAWTNATHLPATSAASARSVWQASLAGATVGV
jgi:parallel beta-helix repeat protein